MSAGIGLQVETLPCCVFPERRITGRKPTPLCFSGTRLQSDVKNFTVCERREMWSNFSGIAYSVFVDSTHLSILLDSASICFLHNFQLLCLMQCELFILVYVLLKVEKDLKKMLLNLKTGEYLIIVLNLLKFVLKM